LFIIINSQEFMSILFRVFNISLINMLSLRAVGEAIFNFIYNISFQAGDCFVPFEEAAHSSGWTPRNDINT
jgi:hypothetical protein